MGRFLYLLMKEELRDMIYKGEFHRYSDKYFELLSKYIKIF